jgi:disulfide bond formation protein DsbB
MNNKIIVLLGCALLIVGVFLPIVDMPNPIGSMNLLLPNGGIGDGIFVLVLAAVAGILALIGKTKHALWPGLLTLAFLVWKFFQVKGSVDQARAMLFSSDTGGALLDSVGMNYLGWAVLLIGALVLVAGSALAFRGGPANAPIV